MVFIGVISNLMSSYDCTGNLRSANAMKKTALILILLCALALMACQLQRSNLKYDPELASYVIQNPAVYYGEAQYYHEVQSVEAEELDQVLFVRASGEIKDNTRGKTQNNFSFNYTFKITDQSIFQILDNNRLNDSDFKEIELLRKPVETGNTWTFDAIMFNNKTTKMTAEIIAYDEVTKVVQVKYTSKDYSETRSLMQNVGITDFTKEVIYKDVKAISGFHIENKMQSETAAVEENVNPIDDDFKAFFEFVEIAISDKERDLIFGFNQNYAKRIRMEDNQIFDFVMPESPASEKINNLKPTDMGTFEFVSFKPKLKSPINEGVNIEVVELYDLGDTQNFVNTVTYTLKQYGDQLMIYDFK